MTTTLKKLSPIALLISLGFIWGTGYSIARFAMTHGVNPLGYGFWQSIGPAALLSWIVLRRGNFKFTFNYCRYYFICGLTGIAVPNTTMFFAASHLPAGLLAVIVNTVPIIAYIMALLARVERFNFLRLSAVIIAFCGILLLLLPTASLSGTTPSPWIFIALLTPACFAFCAVYITRYRPADSDSLSLAAGTLIFSSLLLIPIVIDQHQFYALHFPLNLADGVILLEILLSSLGYILFFQLLKIAGPVYYSFVDSIVAIIGLAWGYLLFNEKLNSVTATAVFLILLALVLVAKPSKKTVEVISI